MRFDWENHCSLSRKKPKLFDTSDRTIYSSAPEFLLDGWEATNQEKCLGSRALTGKPIEYSLAQSLLISDDRWRNDVGERAGVETR